MFSPTRYAIRGWHLGRSLDYILTLTSLRQALEAYPATQIHHSDPGIRYDVTAYTETLQAALVGIRMAEVGEAWQNGRAEPLTRPIKEEAVDLSDYRDYNDAYRQTGASWTMSPCQSESTLPWATSRRLSWRPSGAGSMPWLSKLN